MSNLETLREKSPEFVAKIEAMAKDQLLETCAGEVLDLYSATDRVQLFMSECTNQSKTNYTLDVIKELIKDKKQYDLSEWCRDLIEEYSDEGILGSVREESEKIL